MTAGSPIHSLFLLLISNFAFNYVRRTTLETTSFDLGWAGVGLAYFTFVWVLQSFLLVCLFELIFGWVK